MAHKNISIWVLNKYQKDRIVFETALDSEERYIELKDGVVTEHYINKKHPEESYSVISRSITSENFYKEKQKNDDYLQAEDNLESDLGKLNCSIHNLEETQLICTNSALDVLTKPYDDLENSLKSKKRREKGLEIFDKLTEIQKRRYKMYHLDGLSTYEIAEIEGVDQKAIWFSISAAENKIKKIK